MDVVVIAFVVVLLVLGVLVVVIVRKLGASKKVVLAARVNTVRAEATAEAAKAQTGRITGVAEQALGQTDRALDVAQEIHKVSAQMDELLGFVVTDADNAKHRKNLRVISQSERFIALWALCSSSAS
jgi:hypothetical protein